MSEGCQVYATIERIRAASFVNVAYLGGSLTVAAGAGDSAVTSWRRRFSRYLYERFHRVYHCQPMEVMAGVGAMESYGAVFTVERNVKPHNPVLAFVEFCVNDRGAPDKELVKKGMEGIVRQIKACPTRPDVVLLGAGVRPGTPGGCDHALHRQVAEHYGLGFVDVQSYLYRVLEERGQSWDDVAIAFETGDNWHLNDYGNQLWFECLREWFEDQWQRYDLNPATGRQDTLPEPLVSDELARTKLVNPAKRSKALKAGGSWQKQDPGIVPWYFDDLLVGRPGDQLTYTFQGTAIGLQCLVSCNGLKLEAKVDGEEVPGAYTNFGIEFGKFFLLAHGLAPGEHVLELEVAPPMSKKNKLDDPTAQIGYLCVGGIDA